MGRKNGVLSTALQSKKTVVTRVVDRITEAIIQGELKPGDRLPTEVELCESLQVGRNSIREAIKILESYGVVYIKRADGTYVSDSYNQKMLDPMLYGVILQKDSAEDIIELRKVLDIGMLQVASHKLEQEDVGEILGYLDNLEQEIQKENPDVDQLLAADIAFHMSIAKAIGNELLISMYNYVDRITVPSRTHATELILNKGEMENFIALHRHLVDLIVNHDVGRINEVVNEHYMFWKQV